MNSSTNENIDSNNNSIGKNKQIQQHMWESAIALHIAILANTKAGWYLADDNHKRSASPRMLMVSSWLEIAANYSTRISNRMINY